MTRSIASGGAYCCCADCMMFWDDFDCCLGDTPEVPNVDALDVVPTYPMLPTCLDQTTRPALEILPHRPSNLWEIISGDWWVYNSPVSRYQVPGVECTDGALWCLEGTGSIICKIGWPNRGYYFLGWIVGYSDGLNMTFRIACDGEGNGGTEVSVTVSAGWATVSSGGKSFSAIVGSNPFQVAVCINFFYGITQIGLNGTFDPRTWICGTPEISGGKFMITKNSEASVALDDIYWGRQFIYDKQDVPECPTCYVCRCDITDEGGNRIVRSYPESLYVRIVATCPLGNNAIYDFTLIRTPDCDHGEIVWVTEPKAIPICEVDTIAVSAACEYGKSGVSISIHNVTGGACSDWYVHMTPDAACNLYQDPQPSPVCWPACQCVSSYPPQEGTALIYVSETPF